MAFPHLEGSQGYYSSCSVLLAGSPFSSFPCEPVCRGAARWARVWVMEERRGSGPGDGLAELPVVNARQRAVLGRAASGVKQTLDEILGPALEIGPYANFCSSLSLFPYLQNKESNAFQGFIYLFF